MEGLRTLRKIRRACRQLNIQRIRIHITNLVWSWMIYVVKVAAFVCIVVATFGSLKFFGLNLETVGVVVINVNVIHAVDHILRVVHFSSLSTWIKFGRT